MVALVEVSMGNRAGHDPDAGRAKSSEQVAPADHETAPGPSHSGIC
jgi:hypothetical protein